MRLSRGNWTIDSNSDVVRVSGEVSIEVPMCQEHGEAALIQLWRHPAVPGWAKRTVEELHSQNRRMLTTAGCTC